MQERKIYVFGGWDTPVCYNDMYMLDLGEQHTHKVSKSGETCNYTSMLALLKCNVFMS